jgi:hypothetical protein
VEEIDDVYEEIHIPQLPRKQLKCNSQELDNVASTVNIFAKNESEFFSLGTVNMLKDKKIYLSGEKP